MTWDASRTTVELHDSAADADSCVRVAAARLLDLAAAHVEVGRLCPRCGSSAHGRPWVRAAGATVAASVSRAGPHLLIAVHRGSRVGADIEEIRAVDGRWDPRLVLHPEDAWLDTGPQARTDLWCAKEAILKLRGTGLAQAMTAVPLAGHDLHRVPVPPGYRAVLALG
ncbi:4'-phosphopantetheinyl transferase family protein [Brachybacterium hainanense]|uniref:4'-phosphopantetheinyl transferase family protein n=1 Tax=Brachybacterium hainanense TaxID=1541174 RepID=A0ABV6RGE2_9MICO